MKTRLIFLLVFFLSEFISVAQSTPKSYFWVQLKDKKGTPYQISNPEAFLSQRAISRRIRQHIAIDETDLPVSPVYLDTLKKRGLEIFHTSKWLNGVTVRIADTSQIRKIAALPFVASLQYTRPANVLKSAKNKFNEDELHAAIDPATYGNALTQLTQLNGQYLHNQGFRGKGIQIAVLDAGFWHVNEIEAFDTLRTTKRILGIRDFVDPKSDFYQQNSHGMSVLSCMGGNQPGKLIGTAPDASYYLFRSEDVGSEYLIEEDNWVAAAELADSLGVNVINSSLGYYSFDDSKMNHPFSDMNGKKTRVTKGANMAFQKGILVICSAGNEANNTWKRIIAPSDGENVLAIAAVDKNGIRSSFSSVGPAFGGAVKPNVAAMGGSTYLVAGSGLLGNSSGTSFSSPVLAGMSACLLQSNPYANVKQVKIAIEQSAHQYSKPDSLLGYGIPDFEKADKYLKVNSTQSLVSENSWLVLPNPFNGYLQIQNFNPASDKGCLISIYNLQGILLWQSAFKNTEQILLNKLDKLPHGLLVLSIRSGGKEDRFKLIKSAKE
ncbi:MAG: S8 family serine peptidase [Prolixibacteraceae bacterium]|nr:S8 family serine peptidase [Prolixibacteraceae bacterium]